MAAVSAHGDTRSSSNYAITSESFDAGGKVISSSSYSLNGSSMGNTGSTSAAASDMFLNKSGYVGQLYDVTGLSVSAAPAPVNETGTAQLSARPLLDDATTLSALDSASVSWSIVSGPVAAVDASGVVTAGNVYADTAALLAGQWGSHAGQFNLAVLNVGRDDYRSYAADEIDDNWQVQFFGEENSRAAPAVDADGSGHGNLFKFVAGLNPLDGSRFHLRIDPVAGQPGQKKLVLRPLVAGRTYVVQVRSSLISGSWSPLANSSSGTAADERTVIDLDALPAPKFYRVQISLD